MLNGVRGFNDRAQTTLPSGLPSLFQPSDQKQPAKDYILPFPAWTLNTSSICMAAPTMEYYTDLAMVNGGRFDSWNTARAAGMGMSYMTRADLPYYYALYDAFTVGDQYHQSTYTCTNPNRMHLFTGSNGLSVGQPPVIDNTEPAAGYDWETMGETLERAGVSWKVLQEADNFDDNAFAWFAPFKKAKPGDALFDKGMARVDDLVAQLDADMAAGTLPQVTWIVGPANVSEHATWWPSAGEDLTARILKVVQSHPDIYAKTVFVLNYDEGGQFFDHAIAPMPLLKAGAGVSTVDTAGEISHLGLPVGLGFRVPLLIISPWTRGNRVVSEVFDHTSVVKFLERKFNVTCPNISPWRRAITGDLLSAFGDFSRFDASWPALPDTAGYVRAAAAECKDMPAPRVPAAQTYPVQEAGTRVSVALPYTFLVTDALAGGALTVSLSNAGAASAPFVFADVVNMAAVAPRSWAVAAGTTAADALPVAGASYFLSLTGPNGFVRVFAGTPAGAALRAWVTYDAAAPAVVVHVANDGAAAAAFNVSDAAYGVAGAAGALAAGEARALPFDMSAAGNWYDFKVVLGGGATVRRMMGRMETGADTVSDPAMARGAPGWALDYARDAGLLAGPLTAAHLAAMRHPDLPERFQHLPRAVDVATEDKDGRYELRAVAA
jgi:phospholipase C